MKKIAKFLLLLMIMFFTISTIKVSAAKITIERDENPSGVAVASIYNDEYYIIIDENDNVGYLYYNSFNGEEILGTCTIILIDENNDEIIIANSIEKNAMGEIKIRIDYYSNSGVVIESKGKVNEYFYNNSNVNFIVE